MRMVDLIQKKRDGETLTAEEIEWFINGYTAGEIPDYQASAFMMAIFLRGMDRRETADLTLAMARSGDQLDLHDVTPFILDKHSSGGVGDKTTLAAQPLVAACGVPVGKMSGRGLGSSGGTLDKMESFPGWSPDLTLAQFKQQLGEIGLVLAGQTGDLAPADGKLYALRDVTATVANPSLIAASIMSKKLAAGADAILLDVKVGSGAFMETVDDARKLAKTMVTIGRDAGRRTTAVISDMNQPLGHAVGNALEVKEALETLRGGGPADFWRHCRTIATQMLLLADKGEDETAVHAQIDAARAGGGALEKFRQLVIAQGGDPAPVDDPDLLPAARLQEPLRAPQDGIISAMDAAAIGWAVVNLGGGRAVKGDAIDHAVGLTLPAKIGDAFSAGDEMGVIHANDAGALQAAREAILGAITWTETAVSPQPHIYEIIS